MLSNKVRLAFLPSVVSTLSEVKRRLLISPQEKSRSGEVEIGDTHVYVKGCNRLIENSIRWESQGRILPYRFQREHHPANT